MIEKSNLEILYLSNSKCKRIDGNKIGDVGVTVIANALQKNPKLSCLYLSKDYIKDR